MKKKKSFLKKLDGEMLVFAGNSCLQLLDELHKEGIITTSQNIDSKTYIVLQLNTQQRQEILNLKNHGKAKTRGTTNGDSIKPTTTKSTTNKPSSKKRKS
jgi:DNA-binding MarR family transcriptional regulator